MTSLARKIRRNEERAEGNLFNLRNVEEGKKGGDHCKKRRRVGKLTSGGLKTPMVRKGDGQKC